MRTGRELKVRNRMEDHEPRRSRHPLWRQLVSGYGGGRAVGLTMLTAIWNNDVQATAEAEPYGIPVNINSDPRHSASSGAEYEIDNQPDGELSYWPSNIGLAATFNPKYVLEFGKYSSIELRAMGITTALNPQSDLSTEPRWARVSGSYGEGSKLASDLVTAFTNGYQSTYGEDGEDLGWGEDSVAVITKHFPGDGAASDGREGHGAKGKFRVYPGDNFEYHTSVFLDALTLDTSEVGDDFSASGQTKEETIGEGQTETVSGMMTDYPATWDGETQYTEIGRWGEVLYFSQYGQQVATSYSEWMINNYLREQNGFEGIVVTDWGVTGSMSFRRNNIFGLESYNYYEFFTSSEEESDIAFLEKLFAAYPEFDNAEYFDVAYQQFLILDAGVDQFGGNQDANYVAVAFQLKIDDLLYENPEMTYEEAYTIALEDYKTHAYRSVLAMFNVGLFENPYLDRWESYDAVGTNEANAAGYEAILASIVMIKNSDNVIHDRSEELEAGEKLVVYIPYTYTPASEDWDGNATAATINTNTDVTTELTSQYITVVGDSISEDADPDNLTYDDIIRRTDFEGVDFALVMVSSPEHKGYGAGYSGEYPDGEYVPISLQYGEYTADGRYVKTEQPAYDPLDPVGEDETTRTYYGKSVTVGNSTDLDTILETVEMVEPYDVPVVLVMSTSNPFVPAEFEPYVDAILLSFNATNQAIFEVLAGSYEPQGLLPFQLPRDMDEVERQLEDTPFDMIPYEDADGNSYDYAFGLNWSGVIDDWRTERYGLTCDRVPLLKLIVDEVDDVLYGDTSAYTESSIQALEEAKEAAYEQINEPWNTQENIDAAYDALYNAFTNLEAQ